ncbi:MAG TPA: CPBP family intramembrane glutamic endopeptidase [Candidatus Limnocylindrales bacterium]|nr:CPBP family intramembrane glutamic endopeptidase [Candidatus Limnocylindrales bacterium]
MRLISRFPLGTYFAIVYAASAAALIVLGLPRLTPGGSPNPASLAIFPILVVTVGAAGAALTAISGRTRAIADLWSRMRLWRVPASYYAALLVPPLGILATLTALEHMASPAFAPGFFPVGLALGLVAGFFEEIGWTGYAYPRLWQRFGALRGALLLGLLWGVWHLPVVDSLGVASPHGPWWPALFAAFVFLVTAVRLLICWLYVKTGSVLLAQLMHASSTGFLVVFSAPHVTASQEATWYLAYGGLLWVGLVAVAFGRRLGTASKEHVPVKPT